jgi:serine/threonine-protein kinase HipA
VIELWLYGTRLAKINDAGSGKSRLTYLGDAIDRWGLGSRILTVSAPLATTTLTPSPTAAIVEGLLPEGDALNRLKVAFDTRHPAQLLGVVGRESVGAVIVLPEGKAIPSTPGDDMLILSEGDVAARLRGLPQAPLGVSPETSVRLSLAGAQPKLPLLRLADGALRDPGIGRPSTVILKLEPSGWPRLVELEAYGLAVMNEAGLPIPDYRTAEYEGIKVLEVDRYDRHSESDGTIKRIHQEDLCMAVGARPDDKYATSPRSKTALSQLAQAIYNNSREPDRDLGSFVTALVANVAIGNCDAHARNYSLFHWEDGSVELAPIYDVVPTYHYTSHERHLAQPINANVLRPERVTREHLSAELSTWRLPNIDRILRGSLESVEAALKAVPPPESPELEVLFARRRLFE